MTAIKLWISLILTALVNALMQLHDISNFLFKALVMFQISTSAQSRIKFVGPIRPVLITRGHTPASASLALSPTTLPYLGVTAKVSILLSSDWVFATHHVYRYWRMCFEYLWRLLRLHELSCILWMRMSIRLQVPFWVKRGLHRWITSVSLKMSCLIASIVSSRYRRVCGRWRFVRQQLGLCEHCWLLLLPVCGRIWNRGRKTDQLL